MAETLSPPLLELPGELRNRIYQLCLVSNPIIINSTTFPEPSLLKTCKQVRKEASTIFYGENQFQAWTRDFDFSPAMVMLGKTPSFKDIGRMPLQLRILIRGRPNWCNLEVWLRRRHTTEPGVLPPPSLNPEVPSLELIRAIDFQVAALDDMPWESAQALIQPLRRTLMAFDHRWADEGIV
jgi:hypothetical protein